MQVRPVGRIGRDRFVCLMNRDGVRPGEAWKGLGGWGGECSFWELLEHWGFDFEEVCWGSI